MSITPAARAELLKHPFMRAHVPLAPLTYYKTGGGAEFFARPENDEELGLALREAARFGLPVRVLGQGSNLLVSDAGVRGMVLQLPRQGYAEIEREGHKLVLGAGYSLPGLVNYSVARGLGGLECLVGVPGTVGAALRMNAGGKYGEIGNRVNAVSGFELDGTPFHWAKEKCGFTYRDSKLKDRIVTRCEMELEEADPTDPNAGVGLTRQIMKEKSATQPLSKRSAGCVFKNPKLPGVAAAGKLIDLAGMKGARAGGAAVSTVHANFLVAEAGATSTALADLIRQVRGAVERLHGVRLELEIAAWGFGTTELEAA